MVNFLFRSRIRLYAWLSVISQILIVVTGGAVRLTGSGLGCPTWPECQPGSLVAVPELGVHGFIEFANRLLTFVLLIIALFTFISVLVQPKGQRKGLFWTSLCLGLGIIAQAVIGGISVLTGLNSWIVGLHFLVSAVLIAIATALLWYARGKARFESQGLSRLVTVTLMPFGLLTIIIGILVTGAGPHAGDADTPRNGLDIDLFAHLHSYPAYVTLGLALLLVFLILRKKQPLASALLLLITLIAQAAIGIIQTRTGLPIELVGLHMLGAAMLAALLTWQFLVRGLGKKL
ncbi:MAG: heme A synthase [Microbacteriaceae bacterium]|nr:heme A synthase [Microbacteriaceae bacterium]